MSSSTMGRLAKYTEEEMLDATMQLIAEGGPRGATIAALADRLDAPVGSIYHRFEGRDPLLARLWVRTIRRFQHGFLAALAQDHDLDAAALDAALHVVRWSREHFEEARVLLLFRREDLAAQSPSELAADLAALNADVEAALSHYARRRYGDADPAILQRLTFALIDVPYAAGRRYLLAGNPPPPSIDELVTAACQCILAGDAATAPARPPSHLT